MKNWTRAVLFANGEASHLSRLTISPSDVLVAVDNGWRYLAALGLTPDLLIGDLDSLPPAVLAKPGNQLTEVLRFPPEKDQTDLELALDEVLKRGFQRVLVVGALGGRLDHTLGNLALLSRPDLAGLDCSLDDGTCSVRLVRSYALLATQPGDLVSLVPCNGDALGVSTTGLQYPLKHETLRADTARGISNVALGGQVEVHLAGGSLLLIHTPLNGGAI